MKFEIIDNAFVARITFFSNLIGFERVEVLE